MNNKKIYGKKFADYAEAQAAYNAQREAFEKWALAKAQAHLRNANTILAKYNKGRTEPFREIPGLPWIGKRLTFKEFSEEGLIFTYTREEVVPNSWNRKPQTVTKELVFRTEWLSLSTWAFNKLIRDAIKTYIAEEIERRKGAAAREKQQEVNTLRSKLAQQSREQEKLRGQIARLEEELKRADR